MGAAEVVEKLLAHRHSVRGFLPHPVPQALVSRIFSAAQRAPSNCNAQPWTAHVASGAAAERLRDALSEAARRDEAPDSRVPISHTGYRGAYRERQIAAAQALFAATGVERGDLVGRTASMRRNYRFFDAPHAAFIAMPDTFGLREAVDLGIFGQTLMLLFQAHAIACCPQGALGHYAGILHRELRIPRDHLILYGIAFGFEDEGHPANSVRTERAPLRDVAVFHVE